MVCGRDELSRFCGVRRYAEAPVPGLGTFRLQSLTEGERAAIYAASASDGKLYARLLVATLVDEEGRRLFADEQLDAVLALDTAVSIPLSEAAEAHAGKLNVEGAGKNCLPTADGGSP